MSNRTAVYPGSFDPITLGHVDIIKRIAKLYDEVIVLIAQSPDKASLFDLAEKKALIEKSLEGVKNVKVDSHQGLTVDYARQIGAKVLVRGLRAVVDFEYEMSMGNTNKAIQPDIETILVFASPQYHFISSRLVRDVARHGGPLKNLVPVPVIEAMEKKWRKK
jgi:pantetheine-phosphate adenylyltransferase